MSSGGSFLKKTTKQFQILIYSCILLFLSPIVLVFVLLPLFFIRSFVKLCAKCFGPKDFRMIGQLCGVHAVDKIYTEPIGNLLVSLYLEGETDLDLLKSRFISTVIEKRRACGKLQYPELRQYVTDFMGYSFWTLDKTFNFENHFQFFKTETVIDDTEVQKLRQEFVRKPWRVKQPLWEFIIIEKFQRLEKNERMEDSSRKQTHVVLFRAHHCLLDGYSIVNILVEDMANLNLDKVIAKPAASSRKSANQKQHFYSETFFNKLSFPLRALYEFSSNLTKEQDVNAWHELNTKWTRTGTFTFDDTIPVDYIKEIKRFYAVSFTTVLLAGICAGIRRGMELTDAVVPKFIDCVAVFPVLAHPKKLTNHLTHCIIRLPTGMDDPKQRLLAIEARLEKLKNSTLPTLNFYMVKLIGDLPRGFISKIVTNNFPATVAFSNFPAPNQLWTVNGTDVYKIQFEAGPMLGLGIGYACLSYNGKISLFTGVDSKIQNSEKISKNLIQLFKEELDLLSQISTNP